MRITVGAGGADGTGYVLFPEVRHVHFCDLFVFWLLEKLANSPGPVKPFGVDLQFLTVVHRDDVIHGPDVAAGVDSDSLA